MSEYNLKSNSIIWELQLWKNVREKIAIIPLQYVEKAVFKFDDISQISLKIPQYKDRDNKKIKNRLYDIIKSRQQIVLVETNNKGVKSETRFTLGNQKRDNDKHKGCKEFTAYSWEKTLDRDKIDITACVKQLKSTTDYPEQGMLDLIAERTGWKIGYVDNDARCKNIDSIDSKKLTLFDNLELNNVVGNGLIYEKDVNITCPEDKPLNITINYAKIQTYDDSTNQVLTTQDIQNVVEDSFYTGITNIKAYQLNATNNRWGIKYIFTLSDGVTIEKQFEFVNVVGEKITISNVNIEYDYGDVVKKYTVQYNNFESFNDTPYKLLKNLEDLFKCYFIFDTMTNTINCYAKENYGENKGFFLSLDTNVTSIETTQNETIPSILKVTGKDNLSIASDNPYGSNLIYNYNYYINNGIMSKELQASLTKYNTYLEQKQEEWTVLKNSRNQIQQRSTKAISEVKTLQSRIATLDILIETYTKTGATEDLARVQAEKDTLQARLSELNTLNDGYTASLNDIDNAMTKISQQIKKENAIVGGVKIFSDLDLQEIQSYNEVEVYEDNYYTNSYALYANAVKMLEDKIKPQYEFKLSADNLNARIHHPLGWNYILKLGNLLNFTDQDTINEIGDKQVRFTEMTIVPVSVSDSEVRVQVKDLGFSNRVDKNNNSIQRVNSNVAEIARRTVGWMNKYGLSIQEIEKILPSLKQLL
jgi:hypothetical protein